MPIPGIDAARFEFITQNAGSVFGMFDLFSGGMFRQLTIFALGIMPYITVVDHPAVADRRRPDLEKLQKEGETRAPQDHAVDSLPDRHPRARCSPALIAIGAAERRTGGFVAQSRHRLHPDDHADADHRHRLHHVAGRADHRTRHRQRHVPDHLHRHRRRTCRSAIFEIWSKMQTGEWNVIHITIIVAMMIAVVGFIVLVERGERRIPVQYAKRMVGRRVMGGQSTHLPLKVNAGGVIPVIFASQLAGVPADRAQRSNSSRTARC